MSCAKPGDVVTSIAYDLAPTFFSLAFLIAPAVCDAVRCDVPAPILSAPKPAGRKAADLAVVPCVAQDDVEALCVALEAA